MSSVVFTPDGCGLVSGSWDETLKYWDVSRLANGPDGRPNSPGVPVHDTLNGNVGTREGNSVCTMSFIGHKVRVELVDWGCIQLIVGRRAVYILSLSHTMANGW